MTADGIAMVKTILLPTCGSFSARNSSPVAETFTVVASIAPSSVSKRMGSCSGNRTAVRTGFSPPALFHWDIEPTSVKLRAKQCGWEFTFDPKMFTLHNFAEKIHSKTRPLSGTARPNRQPTADPDSDRLPSSSLAPAGPGSLLPLTPLPPATHTEYGPRLSSGRTAFRLS